MPERLTPERLAEIRLCLAWDPDGLLLAEQRYLFAHIDAQQAEIDRLRALLGETRDALELLDDPDVWRHCGAEGIRTCQHTRCIQQRTDVAHARSVRAKLDQEGL